ncbi:MAG: threonine/serine exporter family protein [Oscillospiraceae bacterium]|nr:threonine/serine exporter family protein [Oscillospiraceae bacterium]
MDYYKLLDFATDLGYELSMSGAETYRVEESVYRILTAYGVESEVFAIPNCLIVSITSSEGHPLTYMRRIGVHGNDLDAVERYSALSRRICAEKPDPELAMQLLRECHQSRKHHHWLAVLLGYFLGSAAFGVFFGGNLADAFVGGLGGMLSGGSIMFMDKFKANNFFKTMLASFPLAFLPYLCGALGLISNPDAAIIGAVMTLIPGLLFTYAMRDIIFGDTNSGVNRIVQVLLIALAIACGTAFAWNAAKAIWGEPISVAAIDYRFGVQALACCVGGLGFSFLFNVRGRGLALCLVGAVLCWAVYTVVLACGGDDNAAMFIGSMFAAIFAEIMARVRKCPAIGFLIMALLPLIPGSSLYYTMNYAVRGEMTLFASKGMSTVVLAGLMAAGVLLVSTSVRMWTVWKMEHKK